MDLKRRLQELREILKIDEKKSQAKKIKEEMNSPEFWLSSEANSKSRELKNLEQEIKKFDDIYELAEIADEEELIGLKSEIDELEKLALFSDKFDENSAILNFYAGAGGDDAQDWTEILLRMYIKWAENHDYDVKIIDQSRGNIAGIKNATLEVSGRYAYGKLKTENGVHRLVRQSPFNAKSLRQTSFSLVEVLPEIEDKSVDFEILDKDLRIETFRSSGHGGQSVNTTDSAVRITHIPTGVTVSCQNERSQMQNKALAMNVLRARLARLMEIEHKERVSELRGKALEPEWGSQIRSYVLHPYKLVKDHRTEVESKSPESVLNGDIDQFIEAMLRRAKNNSQ